MNPLTGELWALRGFPSSTSIDVFEFGDFASVLSTIVLDRGLHALAFAQPCGDGKVDPTESCDAGEANGTTESCCSETCAFFAAGEPCEDGDLCSQADERDGAGRCESGAAVVCAALDPCHDPGTCDPSTGTCDDPEKADGTDCDDADVCTLDDTGQAGICVSGEPTLPNP